MKTHSFVELLEQGAPVSKLTEVIIHELSAFNLGKTVDFNFLSRQSIGGYCRSLGFSTNRNWSMLVMKENMRAKIYLQRRLQERVQNA